MASDYTSNYQLPIWAPEDSFLRTEFNDANQKIDAAIAEAAAGKLKIATGSYTGTGNSSHTVQVGFKPTFFLLARTDSKQHHIVMMGTFAESVDVDGGTGRRTSGDMFQVSATAQGVSIICRYSWDQSELADTVCNTSGVKYAWFALG